MAAQNVSEVKIDRAGPVNLKFTHILSCPMSSYKITAIEQDETEVVSLFTSRLRGLLSLGLRKWWIHQNKTEILNFWREKLAAENRKRLSKWYRYIHKMFDNAGKNNFSNFLKEWHEKNTTHQKVKITTIMLVLIWPAPALKRLLLCVPIEVTDIFSNQGPKCFKFCMQPYINLS